MKTSRRELFRVGCSGLAAVSIGSTLPAFVAKMAFASPAANPKISNDNILVVVQLSGGNDGLNTVIPYADDAYHKARPTIGIKDRYIKLNQALALNPGMSAFKDLYDSGNLAIINGCGYPKPNRSHFESMHIWHTADPENGTGNGWLGHYIDHCIRGTSTTSISPMTAVNIGAELPQALVADSAAVPSIQSIDDYHVKTEDATNPLDAKTEDQIIRDLNAVRSQSPALEFLSRQATNAIISTDQVRKLAAGYKADAEYPYGLGAKLKLIAQLISGEFGTKVFYCETGGFDTHANQPGQHEQLWGNVTKSIAAFHKDIAAKGYAGKVTIMCFSEFGRRIGQNDSYGTDHGTAGPMFVIGDKLRPGIYGAYPSLTDTDSGDLKYTTDFRRVYATMLDNWLNADSRKVLNNSFEPVAFINGMKPTTRPSNNSKGGFDGDLPAGDGMMKM
jgi:uncharacterized protein (DUF1501 family)